MQKINHLIIEWTARGLIKEITDVEKLKLVIKNKHAVYCGFDPTSPSLHIGHLVPLTLLRELNQLGCPIIVLLGEATAQVGDPSFSTKVRQMIDLPSIKKNTRHIKRQIQHLIPKAQILNNLTWQRHFSMLNFLKKVGGLFTVNKMLERKAIREAHKKDFLFYKEFSYILLQAYDFYHLAENYACHLQVGGSDQFANIVFGIDMIRKLNSAQQNIVGVTTNLLTRSSGDKFSKTDNKKNLWLDQKMMHPYDFYQFIYNLSDQDAQKWNDIFGSSKGKSKNNKNNKTPSSSRAQQNHLAFFLIQWIFGEKVVREIHKTLNIFQEFEKSKIANPKIISADLNFLKKTLGYKNVSQKEKKILNIIVEAEIVPSRSQARRLIEQGGIRINQRVIKDLDYQVLPTDLQNGILIVKKGKKEYFLIAFK